MGKWNGPEGSQAYGLKDPKNRNTKGRPRKAFRTFNEELEAKGIERVKRDQFRDGLMLLFNLTEPELVEITKDKDQPMALKIMARELLDEVDAGKYLAEVRDWSLGTAKQTLELTGDIDFDPKTILQDAFKPKD